MYEKKHHYRAISTMMIFTLAGIMFVSCNLDKNKGVVIENKGFRYDISTIEGEKIVFPVKMDPGMFPELNSQNDCKLYGPKGELLQEVKIDERLPLLKQGNNEVSFTCDGIKDISSRVQVTVISEGKPL